MQMQSRTGRTEAAATAPAAILRAESATGSAAEMHAAREVRRLRALILASAGRRLRVELPPAPLPADAQRITAIARETVREYALAADVVLLLMPDPDAGTVRRVALRSVGV